ncbi:hypothetical protein DFH27DRAFT_509716 [Peziza echinospora]|nr:hypothetical protein DFH27DRAFT_509716 [Peziza echinospora]
MSGVGRPPSSFTPTPPQRGSFPLDHDGECKGVMKEYLRCMKSKKGVNAEECRLLAKEYLRCRMDCGLMLPDEFKNLGFKEDEPAPALGPEVGAAKRGLERLEELRRENEELVRRRREEEGRAGEGRGN